MPMVKLVPDYKELFGLLSKNAVEYVVVGGYALAFHGIPRYKRMSKQ